MPVVFRAAAAHDVGEGAVWYEEDVPGRGIRFLEAVQAVVDLIAAHPEAFPVVLRDVRRALVHRFPYAIYYRFLDAKTAEVVACLHTRRRPDAWRARA